MADPIVIVGAGLSGLAAALEIEAAGESCVIFESADHVGGKLATAIVDDAYRLDLGFQILLPSYPELRRFENLESELDLQFFKSGARLEMENGPQLLADPVRHPENAISTALGPYGTPHDKMLVAKLVADVFLKKPESLLVEAGGSTIDYLRAYGFSETIINSFWAPFFSGIFLENELATAAGFFKYLIRMFASPVGVPRLGVAELPKMMARKLTRSEINLTSEVLSVNGNVVELQSGRKIQARAVITPASSAVKTDAPYGMVTSYWFKASEAPYQGAWLSLVSRSRNRKKLINHVAVMSNVSRDYAMKGDALICVNMIGVDAQLPMVIEEAAELYGPSARGWTLLREDRIPKAFPLYLNRTDADTPSQQGALERGRKAAKLALHQM